MGWMNLKSTDPRKKKVVAYFKSQTGCSKVTCVKYRVEGEGVRIVANLLKSKRQNGRAVYEDMGEHDYTQSGLDFLKLTCLVIGLLSLLCSVAHANPDGNIGRLTSSLEVGVRPPQSWSTQQSRYLTSKDPSYYDLGDLSVDTLTSSGYSVDVDFKYPVNESFTVGLGGGWDYSTLSTRQDYTQFTSAGKGGPYANAWVGSSAFDDSHGSLDVRVRVVYYMGM